MQHGRYGGNGCPGKMQSIVNNNSFSKLDGYNG
jgi:hypothetical protein